MACLDRTHHVRRLICKNNHDLIWKKRKEENENIAHHEVNYGLAQVCIICPGPD